MAKHIVLIIVFILIATAVASAQSVASWEPVGVPGFSDGAAYYTRIAIDSTGSPYVALMDGGESSVAKVMMFDGENWMTVGGQGFATMNEARSIDIALDGSIPYVAFVDDRDGFRPKVVMLDGAVWRPVGSGTIHTGAAYDMSIALDNSTPYVAFNSYQATVMRFVDGSWEVVGESGFSTARAQYTSLALDHDTPYVAFRDYGNDSKATVMMFDGANWVTVGPAGFSTGMVHYTSIALNGSIPYVAYADESLNQAAVVRMFDGNDWVTLGDEGFSDGAVDHIGIAMDDGVPYVVYTDNAYGAKATVMKFNGQDWEAVGQRGLSVGGAYNVAMALDGNIPYVVYRDFGNGTEGRATVMRFSPSSIPPVADPNGPYLGVVGVPLQFDGTGSSDPDGNSLTYTWDWGDGTSFPNAGAMPEHSYAAAGVYDVCLTVNDGIEDSESVCTMAVVYDPDGGFVTGGGWIWSEAGSCQLNEACSLAEGKANFGFVSKYKKGADTPTGNTEFQLRAGDLDFHSFSYDWLVVTDGNYARYKGIGTINGEGTYKVMLWAGDGAPDTFRIKIWTEDSTGTEIVVYDNGFDQALGGGNIVVHKVKGNSKATAASLVPAVNLEHNIYLPTVSRP